MNKATQNPDGEVELTSKMDGMGACLLSDAVAKTAEGMMRLVDANIELDKETIQGLFTLMAHASQNVSDYMDTWMADQYRQQQRQKTASAG
ncbi:MAG: hypothetical protein PHW09_01890 [Desulfovibrio desulfuricans]|nr:hypothetical protein [Desulfovibrio desulfuricans]